MVHMEQPPKTPDLLRTAIQEAGHTPRWAAKQARVSGSTYNRKITGKTPMSVAEVARIAKALDMPAAEFAA